MNNVGFFKFVSDLLPFVSVKSTETKFVTFFCLFAEVYTAEFILTGVMRQEKNFNQFQIEVQ